MAKGEKIVRRRLADGTVREYRYTQTPKARTVGAVIAEYRQTPEYRRLKPNSVKVYRRALEIVRTDYDLVAIEDIRRRHVLATRDAWGDKPALANQLVMVWSVLLQFAVEREYILANPATRIKRLEVGEHARWPEQAITYAMGAFPEHLRRAVVLGLFTGQREGDCIRMSWADYDGMGVQVVQEKTGAKLWIPCHADLKAELDRWKETTTSTTILTRATGTPWGKSESFATMFSREMNRRDKSGHLVHPQLDGLVFHGLRKAAAATLAEAGCTIHEIAAVTGHTSLKEIERYTREAEQRQRASAAITKLEEFRKRRT